VFAARVASVVDQPPGAGAAGVLGQPACVGRRDEGIVAARDEQDGPRRKTVDDIDRSHHAAVLADPRLGQPHCQGREGKGRQVWPREVPEATADDVIDGGEWRLEHEGDDAGIVRPFEDGRGGAQRMADDDHRAAPGA
jgi:hypothetical protein